MSLNAGAKEWRPTTSTSHPSDVLLTSDFQLPPSNDVSRDDSNHNPPWHQGDHHGAAVHGGGGGFDPHRAVYVYDEASGEGVLHEEGYCDDDDDDDDHSDHEQRLTQGRPQAHDRDVSYKSYAPPPSAHQPPHPHHHMMTSLEHEAAMLALHQAVFGPPHGANVDENGMPFLPELPGKEENTDWDAALKEFLAAQLELVQQQVEEQRIREGGGGSAAAAEQRHHDEFPQLPQADDTSGAAAFWAKGSAALRSAHAPQAHPSASAAGSSSAHGGGAPVSPGLLSGSRPAASVGGRSTAAGGPLPTPVRHSMSSSASMASAPLTANGKHRWPKQTKAQQRQEAVQKQAFESFANALLHSTSPFMGPLRDLCKSSLPHLKLDQRFGKRGAPHTAVSQFVVAPIVVNYRPRHFHELSPGDLMEYHYDLSQVLRRVSTANCIAISYGPDWKPFAVPFCYLGCRDYRSEVLKLCPNEVPNSRGEAVYEDDIVKDITELVLAIDELHVPLQKWSLVQCMAKRVNLAPMYDAFESIFAPIGNYQIQIRNLHTTPAQFLLKTSQQILDVLPDKGRTGIVLHGDEQLWYELPDAANAFQSGKSCVVISPTTTAGGPTEREEDNVAPSSVVRSTERSGAATTMSAATTAAPPVKPVGDAPAVMAAAQRTKASSQKASPPDLSQPPQAAPAVDGSRGQRVGGGATMADDDTMSPSDWILYGVCGAAVLTTAVIVVKLLKTTK